MAIPIPYRKQRIENAILFFAQAHQDSTGRPLYQTYLYKYLALLEFWSIRERGVPAFGLTYRAMERGPVPLELYDAKGDFRISDQYSFRYVEDNKYVVEPLGTAKPDLDFFSPEEIRQMRTLVRRIAHDSASADEASETSHEEIKAWRESRLNGIMDFAKELGPDSGIDTKESLGMFRAFQEL